MILRIQSWTKFYKQITWEQVKSLFDKSISKDKRYFEETKKKLELMRVRDFRNTIEKFENLKKRVRTIENSITVLERLK